MTETLISSLSNIPNLSVKARSSVFRYKGKEVEPKRVGGELNVQAVLLGRVVQRGEDLTLNLELVDANTENVLWAEKFNRKMKDLVSLQSEIARDVSNKLRLRLSATEREKVAKTYTANSEAQQLYLKGRFHWNRRTSDDFEKAIEYFKQAIERDPNYALAHTGLADTYAVMPLYTSRKSKEVMPLAKKAAIKAIELDDNSAEAHASLAQILQYFDYDWEGAEKEYKRAIEINPSYPDAHQWYGELLGATGRHDDGIAEIKKALKLDPLSLIANRQLGMNLMWARRHDEAITQLKKTLELDPNFVPTFQPLDSAYVAKGMHAEAVQSLLKAAKIVGMETEWQQKWKIAFEKDGWEGFQRTRLEYALLEKKVVQHPDGFLAFLYAIMKDKDRTMENLDKAYESRSSLINAINVHPNFDFLRDDPRFKELIKKVGFPKKK
ncbi:MAG: tetratricopeptide repeat protein, partial [Pyrinomonadaceae bacterium]|nr:tetratricopeptide repeat protein [Pyrinomonadaceae bacterium]